MLLLKDDSPEVRLNIISTLGALKQVIGIDLLAQSLMPAIVRLAEDPTWRVRLAIIEHMAPLAEQLGVKFFDDKLSELCLAWLSDKIFAVRQAAAVNLRKLTDIFGEDWAKKRVLPRVTELQTHQSYLSRLTALYALEVLAETKKPDLVQGRLPGLVFKMAEDPVPNVRFNVAKTLQRMFACGALDNAELLERAREVLDKLTDDADADVRYFGARAVESIEGALD